MKTLPLVPWRPPLVRLAGFSLGQDPSELLRQQGAMVTLEVGIPKSLADQLRASGQPVPTSQTVKGIVDTGASISTVSDAVAQALSLQAVGSVPLYGVGGGGERPVYAASIRLPAYGVQMDPVEMGGVTIGMEGIDVLIGRDILKGLNLDYKGPQGLFNLTREEKPANEVIPENSKIPTGGLLAIGGGVAILGVAALLLLDVL